MLLTRGKTTDSSEKRINLLIEGFNNKIETEIKERKYYVTILEPNESVDVDKNNLKKATKTLFSSVNTHISNDIILYFKKLEKLTPFSSIPKAFHSAWKFHSYKRNKFAVDRLASEVVQPIAQNTISNIFGIRDQ